jgi:hypothetical protein
MEGKKEFNIQEQTDRWVNKVKSDPVFTESDSEELRSHLLDSFDRLKNTGLSDEEAFLIASRRLGTIVDWEEDYQQANNQVIQMRRTILIMSGVLLYFCFYYFIGFSARLFFIVSVHNNINGQLAADRLLRFLAGAHILFLILAAGIYFLEKKTVPFIENIKMKPKHTLLLLFITIIFSITDTCLNTVAKSLTSQDLDLRSRYLHIFQYFDYSFPLMICAVFIILHFKYYKKTGF